MKPVILICILWMCLSASGQSFKTSISETYDNKAAYGYTVSLANSNLHLLRTQRGAATNMTIKVRKTDVMNKTELGETKDELKIREPQGVRLEKAGNKVFIIYQEMDKKGNMGNIMGAEVDTNSLAIAEPRILGNLESTGYEVKLTNDNIRGYRFHWKLSPDKQTILALINHDKNASEFYAALFDKNLNLKWQSKLQLDRSAEIIQHDAAVDNSGKVYVAYRVIAKNKSTIPGRIAIYQDNKKLKELAIDLGGSTPHDIRLLASIDMKKIHVAGLYFDNNYLALQGAYSSSVSTSEHTLSAIRKEAFPATVVQQFAGDGWGTAKQGNAYGLHISISSHLKETGNYQPVITGEFRSSDLSSSNKFYMYSGSILNVYFSADKIHFTRLPKYRVSTASTVGDSYSVFPLQDRVVIFYNDNDENIKKDIAEKPANSNVYSNVIMVGAIINANGEVTRHIVIDMKKDNYVAITDKVQYNGKLFYVPNYQVKALGGINDNFRLATVELTK